LSVLRVNLVILSDKRVRYVKKVKNHWSKEFKRTDIVGTEGSAQYAVHVDVKCLGRYQKRKRSWRLSSFCFTGASRCWQARARRNNGTYVPSFRAARCVAAALPRKPVPANSQRSISGEKQARLSNNVSPVTTMCSAVGWNAAVYT